MKNRAGIVVDAIKLSQMSIYLCKALNKIEQQTDLDVIVFNARWERLPMVARFAILQHFEVWGFDAPVMATDIKTAYRLLKCPLPTKKYFYVWDLEWIFNPPKPYQFYANIYQNDDLQLIARSKSHADILNKCWQKPIDIMENFDHEKLKKFFT